jgi:predicted negative regulator of RcsB-dependent stress response
MFSPGQKIFALIFIVAFVIIIGYQFYKDSRKNKELFKGTYWIIISMVAFAIAYVILNRFLH